MVDLVVIGGGPGGYVAAIRAAQLKKKVVLVERDQIGGVCMNWGCIPTKSLLNQTKLYDEARHCRNFGPERDSLTLNWKSVLEEKNKVVERLVKGTEFLLERNGVEVVRGEARLDSEKTIVVEGPDSVKKIEASAIILATGSRPVELPFLRPNGDMILTSRDALDLQEIPGTLLVVGAGAIGLEMGTIFRRLGTEVTVLEMLPHILPGSDIEMTSRLERLLKRQKIKTLTQMKVTAFAVEGNECVLTGIGLKDNKPFRLSAAKILSAIGRRPNTEFFCGMDSRLELDNIGFIRVNSFLETGIPGIYAVGDVTGGKLLAHKASHEGIRAAENAFGQKKPMDWDAVPSAVFTEPEFASVGITEDEAVQGSVSFHKGLFFLQANGRALTMGKPDGMVKIISDGNGRILGAHVLAPNAGDLLPELTLAVRKKMRLEDLIETIHIHPTVSESIPEACLNAEGRAIHMLNG
ncbi:MAG: dihydrolipoyl dehydrogenase [Candidatus Aminicenantes bacterium]|nr:dihydrolipoyl dehydrogenase [Candidatus Aminicenantes bacterium]